MNLDDLYRQSDYHVSDGHAQFLIKVGKQHPALDNHLPACGRWGYITAWNPASQALPLRENRLRNEALLNEITKRGLSVLKGVGGLGEWSEESYLVFPITKEALVGLGRRFGQRAVLYGERGGFAELVFC